MLSITGVQEKVFLDAWDLADDGDEPFADTLDQIVHGGVWQKLVASYDDVGRGPDRGSCGLGGNSL